YDAILVVARNQGGSCPLPARGIRECNRNNSQTERPEASSAARGGRYEIHPIQGTENARAARTHDHLANGAGGAIPAQPAHRKEREGVVGDRVLSWMQERAGDGAARREVLPGRGRLRGAEAD